MFPLSSTHNFHLYTEATNMRKSFDGLSGLVQSFLETFLIGPSVFIFINKKRDKVKLSHQRQTLQYPESYFSFDMDGGTVPIPQVLLGLGPITKVSVPPSIKISL